MSPLESIFTIYPKLEKYYRENVIVQQCLDLWASGAIDQTQALMIIIDSLCQINNHLHEVANLKHQVVRAISVDVDWPDPKATPNSQDFFDFPKQP